MKSKLLLSGMFLFLFLSNIAFAQNNSAQSSQQNSQDPIGQYFYPPELIMQNQQKLELNTEQKEAILDLVGSSQDKFNRLHWELQSEMQSFQKIIKAEEIEEQTALNQVDKILALENQIKKAQLLLMIKLKNILRTDQQRKLDQLKNER